jgi:prepilin-type N-terminal cleavage/methylation domain-containing protein
MPIPLLRVKYSRDGFTLVEILVASVVLVVAISGAALAFMSANKISFFGSARSQVESAIDQDLANIKDAAYRYTYCSGDYTITGDACNSVAPGQEDYYFPDSVAHQARAEEFEDDCRDGSLSDDLIAAINGGSSSLALSSTATTLGVSRDPAVLNSTVGTPGENSHDIRITYNQNGAVVRRVLVTPTAAAWCP